VPPTRAGLKMVGYRTLTTENLPLPMSRGFSLLPLEQAHQKEKPVAQARLISAQSKRLSLLGARWYLELEMTKHGEQFRGPCPTCDTDNPRALVITPSKGFYVR